MADDLVFEVKAEDNASATLDRVQREIRATGNSAESVGGQFQATSSRGGDLAGSFGKVAKAGLAIGAVVEVGGRLVDFMQEANLRGQEYTRVQGDMNQAIINTADSQAEAQAALEEYQESVRRMADMVGARIPDVQQVMVDLTTRTGEVANQGENLTRVFGLMNLSGKSAKEVTKALGDALNGDLGPMKEVGILSQEQIANFNKMADAGDRAAAMLEVLDQKIEGFAEGLPEAQVQSQRLSASWDRLVASIGQVATSGPGIGLLADLTSGAADAAAEFSEHWTTGATSIGEALRETTQDLRDFKAEAESIGDVGASVGKRQVDALRKEIETQKWLLDQAVTEGRLDEFSAELELRRRTSAIEERIYRIQVERGIMGDREFSEGEKKLQLAQMEAAVARETNDIRKAQLETDFAITRLTDRHQEELAKITDAEERRLVTSRQAAELAKVEADGTKRLREARQAAADERERRLEERMKQEREAYELALEWEKHLAGEEARRNFDAIEAQAAQYDLILQQNAAWEEQFKIRQYGYAADMRHLHDMQEMDEEEKDVRAKGQARDIATGASIPSGIGSGFGDVADFAGGEGRGDIEEMEADLARMREIASELDGVQREALEREIAMREQVLDQAITANEALEEQLRLWGDIGSALGDVGAHVGELAEMQWDFTKGANAGVAALQATAAVGGLVASALAKNTKQDAGLRAAFHTAAAAGALGFALTTGAPQYWGAVAEHTTAAVGFGLVAGGVGGGKGGKSAGGGGGGGGAAIGGGANADAEREKTASAIADAIAEKNQAQGMNVYLDLGSNNVIPTESERFADIVTDRIMSGGSNLTGLNTRLGG